MTTFICLDERQRKVVVAIYTLKLDHEGVGGVRDMGDGFYRIGTGLRAPSMPFYDTNWKQRKAVLLALVDRGLLTNFLGDSVRGFYFKLTEEGKAIAKELMEDGYKLYKLTVGIQGVGSSTKYTIAKNPVDEINCSPCFIYERVELSINSGVV